MLSAQGGQTSEEQSRSALGLTVLLGKQMSYMFMHSEINAERGVSIVSHGSTVFAKK